jgi:hypothetical protein
LYHLDHIHYHNHHHQPSYYFFRNDHGSKIIEVDLPLFATKEDNFFISNVRANKGIQCRFGMRGFIAESHYDSGLLC